ncbi:putative Abc transporter, partial [Daphnia magna]
FAGRQRRGQDHHAAGHLQLAARRARRGDQGFDRAAWRAHRKPVACRPGEPGRGAGHGRPPLLCPPDHRRKPDDRQLHPHRQGRDRGQSGQGLHLFPTPEDPPHLASGLHL